MEDKINRFNRLILKLGLVIAIPVLIILLVIGAGWFGFFFGFASCFDNECSPVAQNSIVIFPLFVVCAAVVMYRLWAKHRDKAYRQEVRREVLSEIGANAGDQPTQAILKLIKESSGLTLEDIIIKSGLDRDLVLSAIKELLGNKYIIQKFSEEKGSYYVLAR